MCNSTPLFAISVLYGWFQSNKEIFITYGAEIEFRDTGRGSACVRIETETYMMELCTWDNCSCLDIQIIKISSEVTSFPHTGDCDSKTTFEQHLEDFVDWFTDKHKLMPNQESKADEK